MESPNDTYLTVDFHYNGMFAPNPLVYLDRMRMSVRNVDFGGMNYREFVLWVSKLTRRSCDNLYYCSTHERLAEGIRRIDNDADYFEFIEDGYMAKNELRMSVYIDHQNEPILDWVDKKMLTGDKVSKLVEDDDTNSYISNIMECEHEPNEEVHTFDKIVDDEFLNKLCGKPILNSNQEEVNDDDDDVSDEDDEVMFLVFDENQEYDKMVVVLGMKFSNPLELKICLTNYAVKNGYDLWFWQVVPPGYMQFEVRVRTDGYVVDLNIRQCGCRAWQLAGYPCVHGYDAISSLNRDPEDYVSEWFTTSIDASCYMYNIRPLNCSAMWPELDYTKPLPPKNKEGYLEDQQ
ncbi:unnamed protein product [Lactuca saligna]|uniref:SWIM-type domain-containing protein n=1 Tax=Lactuca saligna TaxID=75948 RepID=A0AA35YR63_LACSI|nr:unnamed protein product [Lactuca saligna]